MSRRASSRLRRKVAAAAAATEVVDLLSSSDDENMDRKKPAARKKNQGLNTESNTRRAAAKSVEILSLSSDSDDEEGFVGSKSNNKNTTGSSTKAVGRGRAPPSSDAELARWFQQQEDDNWKRDKSRERRDASFAVSLQTEEEEEKNKRKRKEIEDMRTSNAGRSVLLVDKVIQIVERLQQGPSKTGTTAKTTGEEIQPIGKDAAVYLAEKMLELQETFHTQGASTHVCLGYHYTNSANLDCIRTDGLLTIEDRTKTNNKNTKAVAYFGNGLYTATNQYAFHQFGDVGLLVAVLRGKEQNIGKKPTPVLESGINTVIGNKTGNLGHEEIILKQSSQVLPLVRFNKKTAYDKTLYDLIWQLHQQIQHEVLDEYFNGSTRTTVTRTSCLTTQYTKPAAAPPVPTARAIFSKSAPLGSIPNTAGASLLKAPPLPTAAGSTNPISTAAPILSLTGTLTSTPPSFVFSSATQSLASTAVLPLGVSNAHAVAHGGVHNSKAVAPAVAATSLASTSLRLQAVPSHVSQPPRRKKRAKGTATGVSAGQQTTTTPAHETVVYNVPNTLVGPSDIALQSVVGSGGNCSICICPLVSADRDIVKLPNCNDEFHEACIKRALKHSVKCPNCKAPTTEKLQGNSPTGTMTILSNPSVDVSGFSGVGSISMTYVMKGGTQKAFHQNPGKRYSGTTRIAYLPNSAQGRELLMRLKYAFQHGLMFTIGTSLTTHQPNMITWSGIHVKTSPHGGAQAHGWPDPNYFQNVNGELDGLGVPSAMLI